MHVRAIDEADVALPQAASVVLLKQQPSLPDAPLLTRAADPHASSVVLERAPRVR